MRRWRSLRPNGSGVSTVIGAGIFLLLFILSTSAIVLLSQSLVNYVEAVREESGFVVEKSMEELVLIFVNSSGKLALVARNPTQQTIIVTQIWSNHSVERGEWVVPPKGRVNINTDLDFAGMALSKVVTSRGNIFSGAQTVGDGGGVIPGPEEVIDSGRWYVQWYKLSARRVFDTKLGESYWQSLSITFQWGSAALDPIVGPYSKVGFNATTRVVSLGSKMYANWYVNEDIRVIIKELNIDTGWNTGSGYLEANVSPGSVYTVTVLYSRWTGPAYMTLNFIGADFMDLLRGP